MVVQFTQVKPNPLRERYAIPQTGHQGVTYNARLIRRLLKMQFAFRLGAIFRENGG
jgi:hypothetical protein